MRSESFKQWIKRPVCIAFCLALAGLTPQLSADLEALEAEVQADYEQRLGALFEHFHANPELSFVEFKTAARMADEMQALGYDVTSGIGGTGVIGVLENGPGPVVMMRADICVAAIADCFRGEADILCNPIGISPIIGGRLAKATFSPDVVMTDAVSVLATNPLPLNDPDAERTVESYVPYRTIFDIVWSGRRHVMMGATQIDQYGNQSDKSQISLDINNRNEKPEITYSKRKGKYMKQRGVTLPKI